ncbi:MAG: exopolysaccharide biosynthesis protein [Pseudoxanthomonas sp.]|nr:exopolysaccharide biosynthesis protein [Pseudoxanthomonas sp.]MBP7464819.1 exopolysaccharide biosynthesis protein [Pseudoxanthomonas sp.]MBP8741345.1 exopolysaccharide biosynthesis protein [Pseudoxanthomonas sp.]MBP8804187.1 exopolysaccharide biosynthesis protein [Pseudoxanthomonas sp.]MBP9535552.1 exopolysaccharide biosynthesis protein [Pseudoxanthomonas sp.]
MTPSAERAAPSNGIARLLRAFTQGDPQEVLALDRLLYGLGRSAFGMFLFVSVLPGFVPIPGFAGVVSGPLVALIGLQLIVGLRKPWVPAFIGRRGPRRSTMARFCDRITPAMARLEHLVRPRLRALTRSRLANAYTGVLLICLGLLLALPLPMTNFVFAGTLLLFALALMERDGALMLALWTVSTAGLVATGLLSEELARLIHGWLA